MSKYNIITDYDTFTDKEFIAEVYELAFGEDAINREFCHGEVLAKIKEELAEHADNEFEWEKIERLEKRMLNVCQRIDLQGKEIDCINARLSRKEDE